MKVFVSTDGDDIGGKVGKAGLADDAEGMAKISNAIKQANALLVAFVLQCGGRVLLDGGDESAFEMDASHIGELPEMREQWSQAAGASLSVGIGKRLSESGMALMAAKLRGKDQIVLYTPEIEQEVQEQLQNPPDEAAKLQSEYFSKSLKDRLDELVARQGEPEKEEQYGEVTQDGQGDPQENSESAQEGSEEGPEGGQELPEEAAQEGAEAPEGAAQEAGPEAGQENPEEEVGKEDARQALREMVGDALTQIKAQSKEVEAMREKSPEAYAAITETVQAMLDMAKLVLGGEEVEEGAPEGAPEEEAPPAQEPPPEGVEKAERAGPAMAKLPEIEEPNSSGQGYAESHKGNPYHDTMLSHGYKYSHSTPVHFPKVGAIIHHTYELPGTERKASAWQHPQTKAWKWASSPSSASGRHTAGASTDELRSHLKRVSSKKPAPKKG